MQRVKTLIGPWALAFGYLGALDRDFAADADRYFSNGREPGAADADDVAACVRYFGDDVDVLCLETGETALDAAIVITFELAAVPA